MTTRRHDAAACQLNKVPAVTLAFWVIKILSTTVGEAGLAAIFALRYSIERTLSILSIDTRRREAFYWLAILFTFALGTAAGDLATEALRVGFTIGVVVFAALIALATWVSLTRIDRALAALRANTPAQTDCAKTLSDLLQIMDHAAA